MTCNRLICIFAHKRHRNEVQVTYILAIDINIKNLDHPRIPCNHIKRMFIQKKSDLKGMTVFFVQ